MKWLLSVCLLWAVSLSFIVHAFESKTYELETENTTLKEQVKELKHQTNLQDVENSIAKNELNQCQEVLGDVFMASMVVTDEYNKLKAKKCKRGVR